MVITNLSHYELTQIGITADNIVLEGTLAACKRMAAAHGMEIEKYEGQIVSSNCGHAIYTPVNETRPNRIWYRHGGMIQKTQDGYCLVISRNLWEKHV